MKNLKTSYNFLIFLVIFAQIFNNSLGIFCSKLTINFNNFQSLTDCFCSFCKIFFVILKEFFNFCNFFITGHLTSQWCNVSLHFGKIAMMTKTHKNEFIKTFFLEVFKWYLLSSYFINFFNKEIFG